MRLGSKLAGLTAMALALGGMEQSIIKDDAQGNPFAYSHRGGHRRGKPTTNGRYYENKIKKNRKKNRLQKQSRGANRG